MSAPLVSVVIPTYNRRAYIANTVRSVLNQTFGDFEVLVSDDGSTDGTEDVMAEITDPRVKYVKRPHAGRPAIVRNHAIRRAQGKYVAFLDSDDLWIPRKLELQVEMARRNPDAGIVYALSRNFSVQDWKGITSPYRFKRAGEVYHYLLFYNFISIPTVFVPRKVLDDVGLFDEDAKFRAVEDYELWLRIAAKYPVAFHDGVVAYYRLHSANISANRIGEFDRLVEVLKKILALRPVPRWMERKIFAKIELRRYKYWLTQARDDVSAKRALANALALDPLNAVGNVINLMCLAGMKEQVRKLIR
ncbi:MAG: glycosyltransferase [Deltaproteobacteria bacterium]|nr:glycosyltransferase [Deltaproteobacteria bacterium]